MMAQKSHGSRHGTRKKFSRDQDDTTSITDHMKQFEEGDRVLVKYDSSVQEGRDHSRFYGRAAEVTGFRGDAVRVEVEDGGKNKTLFLKPVHLETVGEE